MRGWRCAISLVLVSGYLIYDKSISYQVALRRQQSSEDLSLIANNKSQSVQALMAQKRVYQKHLRSLQQSMLAKDILQG